MMIITLMDDNDYNHDIFMMMKRIPMKIKMMIMISVQEFARAVEGFEERLLNVEQNMQKDVNSIKVSLDMLIQALQMRHEK